MSDLMAQDFWTFRVFGTTLVIFGVCALILAAIGLCAVRSTTCFSGE